MDLYGNVILGILVFITFTAVNLSHYTPWRGLGRGEV